MTNSSTAQQPLTLQDSITLPCGAILKNRLVKSAMSDSLADGEGNPTEDQSRLYERWAEGGAALSIIGEVQGHPGYPEKPGNLVLNTQSDKTPFLTLLKRAAINGAHIWPQLGHAGALSHGPISSPKGPSALDLNGLQCEALTVDEIEALPKLYATTAQLAKSSGFTGVHIHAGHGFLLSQFLSPLFNQRTDQYGGSIEARSHIVKKILKAVRHEVGPEFPIGLRMNASDQLDGGFTEEDGLEVVKSLDSLYLDLIDISGGTYFPGAKSSSDSSSGEPYFLGFAEKAKTLTTIPIMLTGGFKSKHQVEHAISSGATDAVGLARAMVLQPDLPNRWLNNEDDELVFPQFSKPPVGGITAWYTMRLTALAKDQENQFSMELNDAVAAYDKRDYERAALWRKKFIGS